MTLVVAMPIALIGLAVVAAFLSVRLAPGSGDTLGARRAEQPLAHELPYWELIDDDGAGIAVNVDLTYTAFLELQGLDIDCVDNEALNQVNVGLHGLVQNLPPGTVLQFLHSTDADVTRVVERYRANARANAGIGHLLVEAKARELLGAEGLRRARLILAISLPNAFQQATARAMGFIRRFPGIGTSEHQDALRRLRTLRDQVGRALEATGLRARTLSMSEVRRQAYEILNPARATVLPDPFRSGATTWCDEQSAREQLMFTGIVEERGRLVIGDRLARVITLKQLPSWTEPALLEALLVSLPFHCRIALAIETLETAKALDELKRKRDQAHLLATLREKRNQEAEAQEQDVAELIDKNLRSSVRMVKVALSVVLSVDASEHEAGERLDRETAEVLRIVNSLHGAQAMIDDYNQLDEFLATLPANAKHGRRWRQCTSENAAHLLLAWQSWGGSSNPVVLLHNGRRNLVGLDPFDSDLDNPNAFMAGSSGSGKSSTTNYLLLNLLAAGCGALVVDVGGSYRRILEIFGGQYFAVSADGKSQGLNPFFHPRDIVSGEGRLDERRAQFVLAVVERMVCDRARPELRNTERVVLGAAIAETYRRLGTQTPILSDLVEVLRHLRAEDDEDVAIAHGLARDLRVWVEGPAARLVNRQSTFELDTSLAAFDLKGLETQPHLQSVVMVILSGIIWNLVMKDATARKLVVFDEVWRLLESPASAQLIAELYRTSRKYRCSILTISQSVEDFTASSISQALTQNSATAYLLKHRRGHEVVAAQFKLNARELHVFQGLEMRRGEYTEALVLHGDHHFLGRVVLSPLEYWIATTHPADLALEERVSSEHPGLSRLELLGILASRHPRGARHDANPAERAA